MIRYPQALDQIEATIDQEAANWLVRAKIRTDLFAELGRYTEETVDAAGKRKAFAPFWSEVKPVYMRRQHNKCIYCETKLEAGRNAYVQWDLEHFRPKSSVHKWPSAKSAYRYDFDTGDASDAGYYLLAYHLSNYAAACKTCNSPFKSDHFPIASARLTGKTHPSDYESERPFLIYPLDTRDDDPEDIISFDGEKAEPKYKPEQDVRKWRRAQVMIDFFGLNRDGLVANRAAWLRHSVWPNIVSAEIGDNDATIALSRFRTQRSQFTNCSKCFLDLCGRDRSEAERMIPVFDEIIRRMEE